MRGLAFIASVAAVALGAASPAPPIGAFIEVDRAPGNSGKRGKGRNNRRGTGKRSKPKKRPNRLIMSKRVRRKHRRSRR